MKLAQVFLVGVSLASSNLVAQNSGGHGGGPPPPPPPAADVKLPEGGVDARAKANDFWVGEEGVLSAKGSYETQYNTDARDITEEFGVYARFLFIFIDGSRAERGGFAMCDTASRLGLSGKVPCGGKLISDAIFFNVSCITSQVKPDVQDLRDELEVRVQIELDRTLNISQFVTNFQKAFSTILQVTLSGDCPGGDPASDMDVMRIEATLSVDANGDHLGNIDNGVPMRGHPVGANPGH